MNTFKNIEEPGQKSQFISLIRVCLFAGVALWIFGGFNHTIDLFRYIGAEKWPTSKAVIIKSEISKTTKAGSTISYCNSPEITYQYDYAGEKRRSAKWGFSFFDCSSYEFASKIVAAYPVGAQVSVYVKPDSDISVLNPNLNALWLVTLIGVICCWAIWLIRPRKSDQ